MLEIVRNLVSSIFGKILLGIMVLSFALWGVGDILNSGNSQLAAKIGKEKISLDEFYNRFQITVRDYNQNTQSNISLKEAYEMQLHNILLNELIYSKMVTDYAKNKNIFLNNDSLKIIITSLPQFQSNDGKFSELKYKNFIINNFDNEETFLREIEKTVFQGIIFENFSINNFLNDAIIKLLYKFEGEKRNISYFILEDNKITIDYNDTSLNSFYEKNKNNYIVSEKTIIDYLEINIEDFKQIFNIDEQKLKEYYEANINQYVEPESRDIEFVRFNNIDNAREFYLNLKDNDQKNYERYIKDSNINVSSISKFTGNTFSDDINKKIFALEIEEISEPLQYEDIGYYIFKIKKINAEKITNFDEVRNEIKEYLALEDAFIDFDSSINAVDDMLLNDFNIDEINNIEKNTTLFKSKNFNEFLKLIDLKKYNPMEEYPIGYTSEVIISDSKAYVFTIKDKISSYIPSLEEIKGIVTKDYTKQTTKNKLDTAIDEILIELQFKDFSFFEKYANKRGSKVKSKENISRINKDFGGNTIIDIFGVNQSNVIKVELQNGEVGVGIVTKVISPDEQISENLYNSIKNNTIDNFNTSLENIIGNEIIENSSYKIYNQNIEKLFM